MERFLTSQMRLPEQDMVFKPLMLRHALMKKGEQTLFLCVCLPSVSFDYYCFPAQSLIVGHISSSTTDTGWMREYYSLISTPPRRSVSDTMCMIALRCSKNIVLLVWLSALASAALVRQIHLEPKANEVRDAQYVDCNEQLALENVKCAQKLRRLADCVQISRIFLSRLRYLYTIILKSNSLNLLGPKIF